MIGQLDGGHGMTARGAAGARRRADRVADSVVLLRREDFFTVGGYDERTWG